MRHNYIGEIEVQKGNTPATLSCEMLSDADMAFILCDELGKTHFEENFKLKRGVNNITLHLADLKGGNYNAWIQIQGKTFLRKLYVNTESSKSLFSAFGKIFKQYG